MIEAGRLAGTKLVMIRQSLLTESVPGKFYHLRIETNGIADPVAAANALVKGLWEKFRADVVWIRVDDRCIELQLRGSPFAWSALLPWIGTILSVLGITVILLTVYYILAEIPSYAWGLLAIGIGLLFFGPSIGKAIKETYVKAR